MTKVDCTGQPEIAKAYKELNNRSGAGKGCSPRNCWSESFRKGYDRIFRRQQHRRQSA